MGRFYIIIVLFLMPFLSAAQSLIVIPEEKSDKIEDLGIEEPKLEDFTDIDSLGNEVLRMEEWRMACRKYRREKRYQEQKIHQMKGGDFEGGLLFLIGGKQGFNSYGVMAQIKREHNPWTVMAKIDYTFERTHEKNVFFQELEDETIYSDRKTFHQGQQIGFGLGYKVGDWTPFAIYNFGTVNKEVRWIDFSTVNETYATSSMQLGTTYRYKGLQLLASYMMRYSYFQLGIGFTI